MFLRLNLKLSVISFEPFEEARTTTRVFTLILYLSVRKTGCYRWIENKGDEKDLCNRKNKNSKRLWCLILVLKLESRTKHSEKCTQVLRNPIPLKSKLSKTFYDVFSSTFGK